MESWKLNTSLLSRWDREVQRGIEQLNWEIRSCSEPQIKAWNYKRRPRGWACLWGTFCRVRNHWMVFCRSVEKDSWSKPSTIQPLRNSINKSTEWEQPSSQKTSWAGLLKTHNGSGGGGLTSSGPVIGPRFPCILHGWVAKVLVCGNIHHLERGWEGILYLQRKLDERVLVPQNKTLPGREKSLKCI